MDMQQILEKIAYGYYEKFKSMGFPEDNLRDWRYAEKCLNHLLKSKDEGNEFWKRHEEDFQEFRDLVDDNERDL